MSLANFTFYLYGFVSNIICLLGLLGNTLTLYILNASKDMRKQTINIYLTVLALYDNGVLIFSILMLNLPAITNHYQQQQHLAALPVAPTTTTTALSEACANMSANFNATECLWSAAAGRGSNNNSTMNGTYNLDTTTLTWLPSQVDYGPKGLNVTLDNNNNNITTNLMFRLGQLLFDRTAPPLDMLSASANLTSSVVPPDKNTFFKTSSPSDTFTTTNTSEEVVESLFGQIYTHCFNLSEEEQRGMLQSVVMDKDEDHNNTILVQAKTQLVSYLERTAHLRSNLLARLMPNETSPWFDPMGCAIAHNLADGHECRLAISLLMGRVKRDLESIQHPSPPHHHVHHHRHKTDSDPATVAEPSPQSAALSSPTDFILLVNLLDTSHRYIEKLALVRLESDEAVFGEHDQDDGTACRNNSEPVEDKPWLLESYVKFVYPMALLSQTGSIWTTCLITIERYLAVCHPLKSLTLSKRSRAIWALIMLSVAALAFNVPRFWEVDTSCGTIRPSDLRRNKIYFHVYYTCLNLSLNYILPLSLLFYLNIRIYSSVRHANEHRNELTRARQSELHLASMLVAIVAIFIACNAPAFLTHCLEPYLGGTQILDVITVMSNVLVCFNSAINFVIYCIFGKKFRRRLKQALGLGGSRCSKNSTNSTRMSYLSRQFSASGVTSLRVKPGAIVNNLPRLNAMVIDGNGQGGGGVGGDSRMSLPIGAHTRSADSSDIDGEKTSTPSAGNANISLSLAAINWTQANNNNNNRESNGNGSSAFFETNNGSSNNNGTTFRKRCNTVARHTTEDIEAEVVNNSTTGAQMMRMLNGAQGGTPSRWNSAKTCSHKEPRDDEDEEDTEETEHDVLLDTVV